MFGDTDTLLRAPRDGSAMAVSKLDLLQLKMIDLNKLRKNYKTEVLNMIYEAR